MIEIPFAADKSKNLDRLKGNETPCIVCGRAVTSPAARELATFYGSDAVTLAEYAELQKKDDGGETGVWPIGPDCLRKHPELEPYLLPLKRAA